MPATKIHLEQALHALQAQPASLMDAAEAMQAAWAALTKRGMKGVDDDAWEALEAIEGAIRGHDGSRDEADQIDLDCAQDDYKKNGGGQPFDQYLVATAIKAVNGCLARA